MKKTLSLLLILMSTISISANAQSKDEKQVAAAVEVLKKAMIDASKTTLENISSDALSYGHSSGKVQDKAAFVAALVSGESDFVTIDFNDQTIVVKDQTAIVRHKLTAKTNDGGKPGNVSIGVMLVWVKEKGNWKLLGRQAFKL